MTSASHKRWIPRVAVAALTATMVLAQMGWTPMIVGSGGSREFTERDWIAFYRAGHRVVDGQTDEIYLRQLEGLAPGTEDGFYFLYPPFFLWVVLPLGFLGAVAAYAACAAAVLLGTSAAFASLLAVARTTSSQRLLAAVSLVGSAPWNAAVYLGHLGVLLFVPLVMALRSLSRGRLLGAGLFLGVLLAKPNLGLPMLAFLLVGRCWRIAAGAVLAGVGMFLSSLPFGLHLWEDWWQTMGAYGAVVADGVPVHKQATILAVLRSATGLPGSHPLVTVLWVASAGGLLLWTARHWYRLGRSPGAVPRLLAVSILAILVANPYVYTYDLLLLAPAALMLWTAPHAYRRPVARRWGMGMTVAAYYLVYAQLLGLLPKTVTLLGLPLAIWLVLELRELEFGIEAGAEQGTDPAAPATSG